jgi:hypothetical protein
VLPLLVLFSPAEAHFWRLDEVAADPLDALWRFATLQYAPRLLDVLQLYIRLMLIAPLAIWIHRRSPATMLVLSVACYLLAQALTIRILAADPEGHRGTVIDLLAWQLLFFVPMALGARRVHVALFRWLEGNWTVLVLFVLLFAAGGVAKHFQELGQLGELPWLKPRYGLHPLRLGHAVLVLLLYASALTLARRHLDRQPFPAIAAIGRHSLDCFCIGVLVTFALGTLWIRVGGGHATYYLFALLGIAVTVFAAYRLDARRTRPSGALP